VTTYEILLLLDPEQAETRQDDIVARARDLVEKNGGAPPEVREARRGTLGDREDRLVPEEEKVRRADFCFVNDGSLEELDAFVAEVLEELRRSR
jgi:hypothetical protein